MKREDTQLLIAFICDEQAKMIAKGKKDDQYIIYAYLEELKIRIKSGEEWTMC